MIMTSKRVRQEEDPFWSSTHESQSLIDEAIRKETSHHLATKPYTSLATLQWSIRWSIVSPPLDQTGHIIVSSSMPLLERLKRACWKSIEKKTPCKNVYMPWQDFKPPTWTRSTPRHHVIDMGSSTFDRKKHHLDPTPTKTSLHLRSVTSVL